MAAVWAASASAKSDEGTEHAQVRIKLPVSTQGPMWPPAEVTDDDGNFIVVGNLLKEVSPGMIGMVPQQAAIVSKDTVPPLDANGKEDPDNWFGATHRVVRPLDLSPGSPDLNIVLRSNSFGPQGTGKSPRIPREGDSAYNLNGDLTVCKEVFPSDSQKDQYTRPRFPLHQVPILGFQGDNVAYDVDTGAAYDPKTASNDPSCAATGCSGEDAVDQRRTQPITLGDWLKSEGSVNIHLTKKNAQGQFTHAEFKFELRNMLPNSVYTVWGVRMRQIPIPNVWTRRDIDPLSMPNIIVTDSNGSGEATFEVPNPFPDPKTDTQGLRLIALSVVYHSDHQTWGGCFSRFGPGVDVHVVFNTMNAPAAMPGTMPTLTDKITVAP
jgi:hypothetical protein